MFGPNLFQNEHCVAARYLDQWLITLIRRLFESDFINHTWSTFPFLTLTLNNGRPHWVWPWGCESEPSVTDPWSILIHHVARRVCVGMWGKLSKERKRTTWCIPHRSYNLIMWMEWVSQPSTHTLTHDAAPSDSSHAARHSGAWSNPTTPTSNLIWHL